MKVVLIGFYACTEIEGGVTIQNAYIDNLKGLSVLTSIGETLMIDLSGQISYLTGLENIATTGGSVTLHYAGVSTL